MYDRNVKSECMLIKLCALVFEYVSERTTKFHEKILFDSGSGVINIQIPMTKYLQYSGAYCSHLSLVNSRVNNKHGIFRRRSCFN